MLFRKLSAVVLAGALAAGLAACGDDDDEESTDTTTAAAPADTGGATSAAPATTGGAAAGEFTPTEDGKLIVATSLPAPGFWGVQGDDDPDDIQGGLEWAMAQEFASRLGLEYELMNVDFTALQAGQITGYDIALSQISITDPRKETNEYSDPYYSSGQGVMVNAGTTVASVEDAKAIQWGVQSGTTAETFLADTIQPDSEPQSFQDTPSLFQALLAEQVDAVLLDTAIVLPQTLAPGFETTEVVGQFDTGDVYGVQLPKGSPNVATINDLLAQFESEGLLEQWAAEYLTPPDALGADPTAVPFIPTN